MRALNLPHVEEVSKSPGHGSLFRRKRSEPGGLRFPASVRRMRSAAAPTRFSARRILRTTDFGRLAGDDGTVRISLPFYG